MTIRRPGLCLLALLCAAATFPGAAATITLDAVNSGFYFAAGTHNPAIQNHLTGLRGTEHRSDYVFDLSTMAGTGSRETYTWRN
jgi:hypothetical protein